MSKKEVSYSKKECEEWLKNKLKNPKTNRSIKKDGPTYKLIAQACAEKKITKRVFPTKPLPPLPKTLPPKLMKKREKLLAMLKRPSNKPGRFHDRMPGGNLIQQCLKQLNREIERSVPYEEYENKKWHLKSIFAQGGNQAVFFVCQSGSCEYLVRMGNKEATKFSKAGIGPKILDDIECFHKHLIIMEKYAATSEELIIEKADDSVEFVPLKKSDLASFEKQLKKLHDLGYCHGDMKPDNVVMRASGSNIEFALIDFDMTRKFENMDATDYYDYLHRFAMFRLANADEKYKPRPKLSKKENCIRLDNYWLDLLKSKAL